MTFQYVRFFVTYSALINNGAEWQSINIGFLLALVSAIFLAFDTIIGRSLRNYPYEVVSFYNQAFGLVFLVSLALLTFELPSAFLIKDVTLLLIPASIIGGASSMLYYFSLRQLEATWVGLITPLQVVVASLFAFLFFTRNSFFCSGLRWFFNHHGSL